MSGPTTARIYRVRGLSGSRAGASVSAAVGALDPVIDVHVEVATGDVTVRSTRPLSHAEIATAIDQAGREPRG